MNDGVGREREFQETEKITNGVKALRKLLLSGATWQDSLLEPRGSSPTGTEGKEQSMDIDVTKFP